MQVSALPHLWAAAEAGVGGWGVGAVRRVRDRIPSVCSLKPAPSEPPHRPVCCVIDRRRSGVIPAPPYQGRSAGLAGPSGIPAVRLRGRAAADTAQAAEGGAGPQGKGRGRAALAGLEAAGSVAAPPPWILPPSVQAKSPLAGWSQRPTRSRSHAPRRNAGPPPGRPVFRACPRSGTSLIPQRPRKRPLSRIRQFEYV
ncbi:unnamed protein product [Rangifer tarandus platyrhynchus]|uniref:Uncharacterized protein n=1 Tax=Rangifer tarandus platyrhynchus TaxID=3082113 RepID=A0AC59ZFF3_RANTA